MDKAKSKIIVFARNPEKGKVKTRIGNKKGHDIALSVYLKLLDFTKDLISTIEAEKIIYLQDNLLADSFWSRTGFNTKLQVDGDLGEKMAHALACEMEKNAKVIIIGSDCGELTKEDIELALKQLDKDDVVIGPATDGGYYLIGMKELHSEIFKSMPWSENKLFRKTIKKIEELGLKYSLLKEKSDVDYWEDWVKLGW